LAELVLVLWPAPN